MDITSIVIYSVFLYVAFKIGQWSIIGELVTELKKHKELLDDDEPGDEEKIKIEKHHETYYAFGSNDRFLGQGSTFHDLFTTIKNRFPNHDFRIDKHPEGLTSDESMKLVDGILTVFGKKETK